MAKQTIGVIGLGIMGHAYAANLIAAGFPVIGADPVEANRAALIAAGGQAAHSARAVAAAAHTLLLALPSVAALDAVTADLLPALGPDHVLAEMSTLPVSAKQAARDSMATAGAVLLDCPVSGTGAQAAAGELVVYTSGPPEAADRIREVLAALGNTVRHVGDFGAGMKLKLVANLLVAVHNLATAEALSLAAASGLDLSMVYDTITAGGAANSRIFQLRGPLMVRDRYSPPTMKMEVFMKDIDLIRQQAKATGTALPLLDASLPVYEAAMHMGLGGEDTAALFRVLKGGG